MNLLTSDEEIVWRTYIQAADDFSVMRFSLEPLRDAHDRLAAIKPALLQRMLERVAEVGLLQMFDHQERRYCYQADWQEYQKIRYPGRTSHPRIPGTLLATCHLSTQWLHTVWPGGGGRDKKLSAWQPKDDWIPPDWTAGSGNGSTPHPHPHPPPASASAFVPAFVSASAGAREDSAAEPDPALRARFEEFWDAYPCKVSQDTAWVMWCELAPDRALTDIMLRAIRAHEISTEWQKEQGRYIPHPQNWLKKRRWEDAYPTPALAGVSRKTAGNVGMVQRFAARRLGGSS